MTTVSAIVIALILANTFQPGEYFPEEKTIELKEKYASDASMKISSAKDVEGAGPLQMMIDVCLLYTSPSPRDGLLSRMPSSA